MLYEGVLIYPSIFGEPCPGIPTVEYEGQIYNTILIGEQCWLKENLNVGTMINSSNDQTNNGIIEKYCYDDDESNCDEYGGLYQWNEIMEYTTTQGTQGICPDGWHIPSDDDWCTLTTYIDPTVDCNSNDWIGTDAGYKMKSTSGWYNNGNGSDAYGFNVLPSGYSSPYVHMGIFDSKGYNTYFWTSSQHISNDVWYLLVFCCLDQVNRNFAPTVTGNVVRCVKD